MAGQPRLGCLGTVCEFLLKSFHDKDIEAEHNHSFIYFFVLWSPATAMTVFMIYVLIFIIRSKCYQMKKLADLESQQFEPRRSVGKWMTERSVLSNQSDRSLVIIGVLADPKTLCGRSIMVSPE